MPTKTPPSVLIDGAEIRRRRKERGLNLRPFAQLVDVTEGYVSHIESGRRNTVSPRVFGAICDALGVENRQELMLDDNAEVPAP